MNREQVGKNVLITTVDWFYAPNGKQYRAVWGKLTDIKTAESSLGIRPNGRSTNWYVEIGDMTIAGCQVNYAIVSDTIFLDAVEDFNQHEGRYIVNKRPSAIYNANGSTL